ncbi:DUF433 domain-containing protein [Streptomyces sp. NBC_01236]|uniref:DUF433 domain-containing protein n=1 Tax=Streptomyces sp. NBC_01236 TaxID=2903789 RepID=UPI002E162970|nr:DUF433 domain-containing protein [Streptomyces sp. NBC_01236]
MAGCSEDVRFSVPLYTQAEAAGYLDMAPSTLRRWARGYHNKFLDRPDVFGESLITYLGSPHSPHPSIPFIGLAEGMFLSALRRANVPLQKIRPALELVRQQVGVQHALASRRLYVVGAQLLYEIGDDLGGDDKRETRKLIVLKDGQYVFREVIDRYLTRIEYDDSGNEYARKIDLPGYEVADITVLPGVNFGQPFFTKTGTPLYVVQRDLRAGESVQDVADDYGLPVDQVDEVQERIEREAA